MDKFHGNQSSSDSKKTKKKKKKKKINEIAAEVVVEATTEQAFARHCRRRRQKGDPPPARRPVDDARVAKVATGACCMPAAKDAIAKRNDAVRIWELVRERIRCAAWDTMLQRSKTAAS